MKVEKPPIQVEIASHYEEMPVRKLLDAQVHHEKRRAELEREGKSGYLDTYLQTVYKGAYHAFLVRMGWED